MKKKEIIKPTINNYKKIDPPFGYFGSKNKLAKELCKKLPPHNCWVELFCGSAALTLFKPPAAIEIINDIDKEIVNVFTQLRRNTKRIIAEIESTPYAADELDNARKPENGKISDIERARRFLIQSMMAINGVFGEERSGFSHSDSYTRNGKEARVSRWQNLPDRLYRVAERLRNARIENKDALKLLPSYMERPATLIYLDPPYLGERTNGYNNDANCEDFHKQLLALCNKAKCMIFISGYKNDLYDTILTEKKDWKKKTIKTTTKDSSGTEHKRTEVVWMNKYFTKALSTKRIPVKLSKKEKNNKKVNPKRMYKK